MMERAIARTMTMTIHFCRTLLVIYTQEHLNLRSYPMIVPPAPSLWLFTVPSHGARRRRSCSTSSGRRRCGRCRRCTCRSDHDRSLSSTSIVRMFACAVVATAVPCVPGHDLLVLRRVRTEGIANAARRRFQAGEICRLAEAGPNLLVCALKTAACRGGIDQIGT
jgi:hypothetical protein